MDAHRGQQDAPAGGRLTSPSGIAEELRTVLGRLVRRLRTDYPVAPHQFGVLRTLERSGAQTTSALAVAELVRPQSMAHTIQQLTTAGLVSSHPDHMDRRQKLISLTDDGRTVLDVQREIATGWLAAAIDERFNADEQATLSHAVMLLNRLLTT